MMHVQQDIFDHGRLAVPTARISTITARWSAVMDERRRLACEIDDTLAQAFAWHPFALGSRPRDRHRRRAIRLRFGRAPGTRQALGQTRIRRLATNAPETPSQIPRRRQPCWGAQGA